MIYDIDMTALNSAYTTIGNSLNKAYSVDGNVVFSVDATSFVVMSYNVETFTGINANEEMQQSIIDTYDADIIGMQEMGATGFMPTVGNHVLTDYTYRYFGPQSSFKTAIVSKHALSDVTSVVYANQSARAYQKAYLTIDDKRICWLNTHLETSAHEADKVAEAQELFEAVANEDYFIITGDFNTTCKSINDAEYTTIMKQFVDAGYHCANCSTQHGFNNTWTSGNSLNATWYPCDHVITSSNIDIDRVVVDTTKIDVASQTGEAIDHLPIVAYLTIF